MNLMSMSLDLNKDKNHHFSEFMRLSDNVYEVSDRAQQQESTQHNEVVSQ